MSLFATLLLDRPVTLPTGIKRRHLMEDGPRHDREERPTNNRNVLTALANAEAVLAAVAAGCTTHAELEDATGLSQSTVKKALYALEDWPTGPRISRDRRNPTHRFEVIR